MAAKLGDANAIYKNIQGRCQQMLKGNGVRASRQSAVHLTACI